MFTSCLSSSGDLCFSSTLSVFQPLSFLRPLQRSLFCLAAVCCWVLKTSEMSLTNQNEYSTKRCNVFYTTCWQQGLEIEPSTFWWVDNHKSPEPATNSEKMVLKSNVVWLKEHITLYPCKVHYGTTKIKYVSGVFCIVRIVLYKVCGSGVECALS